MRSNYPRTAKPHGDRADFKNLRAIVPYVWEFRGRVALALSCLVLAKVANVGLPLVLKQIVDSMSAGPGREATLPIVLLMGYGMLRLSNSLFNELRDAIFAKVRFRAMRRLSTKILNHLHSLSLRFHLERKTGAISRDLERGTRSVSAILNYLVFNILPTSAEFVLVASLLLLNYDPKFAAVTFGTVAVYVAFTFALTEWRMHFRHTMNALDSKANTQAIDSLVNYETVKYFSNERYEAERYDQTLARWEQSAVKSQTSMSALNFGQGTIIALGVTLIMVLASQGVVQGQLTIGDLVMVNAFLLQLFIPLNFLGIVYRQVKYSLADMDLMLKLLAKRAEVQDRAKAQRLTVGNGEVMFENVSFAYDRERPILHRVSFTVSPGRKVAVVGASGAGKSTLARLLFRFYDVTEGQILINGQEIRNVTQSSLRAAIGIVPQDTVLFNASIYDNIAYARPEAGLDGVIRAARLAHVHHFIEALPQGYDTVVGERGLKLSGGEKQRIAIARVILKDPQILVFDEATSALDSNSEQAILVALREVAARHPTLAIAHRLSTIVDADEILVMDAGRIVERGSHTALLGAGGIYAQMWTLQLQERERRGRCFSADEGVALFAERG
jgi:ABC-type transport system involved in Fe-S cluster assembly fused permease/ATPase subunit